jgi:4-azaleucine resistance transporter AzlC
MHPTRSATLSFHTLYNGPVSTPRSEFLAGVRSALPLLAGTLPFGLIYGVLGASAGLPPAITIAMSSLVYAGSAQFVAADQIGHGVPSPVVVLTTFVVNLRHMLYSASLGPYLTHLSRRWKLLLAYLLTDETYAATIGHYQQAASIAHQHWFFFGSGLTLWIIWQCSTLAGVVLGAQVPARWGLEFSLALTFIGLVLPALRDRAVIAAALTAGLAAVALYNLPLRLGLIAAAAVGIAAGLLLETLAAPPAPAAPDGGD